MKLASSLQLVSDLINTIQWYHVRQRVGLASSSIRFTGRGTTILNVVRIETGIAAAISTALVATLSVITSVVAGVTTIVASVATVVASITAVVASVTTIIVASVLAIVATIVVSSSKTVRVEVIVLRNSLGELNGSQSQEKSLGQLHVC
jgi:hypothetical protein